MYSNSYGECFRITTFGESHGAAVGVIIDGCPSGLELNNDDIQKEFNDMYNILFAIGVVFSVIIGAMLGLKYMFGSIEEQVKVKESLIGYVIGCFVIFGAFGIWKFVILILANV